MAQEIELKMLVEAADVPRLSRHPLIARHAVGSARKKHLVNHYFDTPDRVLKRNFMALRVRSDGSGYIQTLKRKGESRDGLAVREEWEWGLEGPHIDTDRVPPELWPPELKDCPGRLAPVFRTDFHRTLWHLDISAESGFSFGKPARVEMSLDQGVVAADSGRGPAGGLEILEVEFELLAGDPEVLMEISGQLGRDIRLTSCDISKAERGYRLIDGV